MRHVYSTTLRRSTVLLATLVGMAACASGRVMVDSATQAADAATIAAVRPEPNGNPALEFGTPRVVVRDYPNSPAATVVAWTEEEPWQGLRASVRLDGTMLRDHRIFVSTFAFSDYRIFTGADWRAFSTAMKESQPLIAESVSKDVRNCDGDQGCSPYESFSVRLPDDFLRGSQDSVLVKIFARNGEESSVTLHRPLITRYLAKLDSVLAARRARAAN